MLIPAPFGSLATRLGQLTRQIAVSANMHFAHRFVQSEFQSPDPPPDMFRDMVIGCCVDWQPPILR